jgi:diacylglycerol kinase family enzyme
VRALLVANPQATANSPRHRDVLVRALASELKLDIAETAYRGHATRLAAEAVRDGRDLVLAFGGDGTVNEVVNGLLEAGPGGAVLGVVPGGGANVFARALGLPTDPVEATSELLDALRAGRTRSISLGRADERWFTFTAGLGIDASAVKIVERARRHGRTPTAAGHVRAAVRSYLGAAGRRRAPITLSVPGRPPLTGLHLVIASNTAPWTWFGERPVQLSPKAAFGTGLELLGMRRLGPVAVTRAVLGMIGPRGAGPRGRAVVREHDLADCLLRADRPMDFELDGEYLGERETVSLRCVRDALRVLEPDRSAAGEPRE